ncbi:MAG: DUF6754 domain-containing protein [Anaerolineales bacterium]
MAEQIIALAFVLVGATMLAIYGLRYRETPPATRDYPLFHALSDEVGRVAEEGKTIHIALGNGGLASREALTSVAALQSLNALFNLSAAYDAPPLITTSDPTLYLLAGDWMRRAYTRIGNAARYRPLFVQFAAPTPTIYAAMTATYIFDGGISSNIMLGAFDQEISLLAEATQRRRIHSMGGTTSLEGISALYPVLPADEFAMGEDLFAGGAEVIRRSPYWASLSAHDTLRWLTIAGMMAAAILSIIYGGG